MKKFCSSEHIRPMIRLTGGELPEVFALTVHDIVPAEYGHINIHIGIGRRRRIVFVYDDKIPMQLLDAAVAEAKANKKKHKGGTLPPIPDGPVPGQLELLHADTDVPFKD